MAKSGEEKEKESKTIKSIERGWNEKRIKVSGDYNILNNSLISRA